MKLQSLHALTNIQLTQTEMKNDEVYELLKLMIMQREFTPNERLDSKEIARKLNMSRTPIRDALNKLTSEGFVTTQPRKGIFITGIYKEDLLEVFQQREMIELFAVDIGFEKMRKDLGIFRENIQQWEKLLQLKEFPGNKLIDKDIEFHKHIVSATNNKRIIASYENLNCHVHISRGYYLQDISRIKYAHTEHQHIVDRIDNNDINGVKKAIKEHIRYTLDNLLIMIDIYKVF